MDDLSKFTAEKKVDLHNILSASEDASPFFYHLAGRMGKGALVGLATGVLFFRSSSIRRCSVLYGAGFGLGCSSSQVQALYGVFNNSASKSDSAFERDLDSIQTELQLRSKLR